MFKTANCWTCCWAKTSLDCGLEGLIVSFYYYFNYRKIVDRIDSDGDGLVTTEELKLWIKRVQKRYIYDNVAKVWKDYDRDKDEKISGEEYKQATYGYYLGKRPWWRLHCGEQGHWRLIMATSFTQLSQPSE